MSRSKGGVKYFPQYFERAAQQALLADLRRVIDAAPLFTPTMPRSGKPMSVRMTNCGPLGWVTDEARGYRYQGTHPETGAPWPPIPDIILRAWRDLGGYAHPPEACLINFYSADARMGLHQDKDEQDFAAPVVSLSLGDTALFRVGGLKRSAVLPDVPTISESGLIGYLSTGWRGMMGPAGMPPAITARLTREVKTILTSNEVKTHFLNNAMEIDYRDPQEFAVFIGDEIKRWNGVVRKANISLQQK